MTEAIIVKKLNKSYGQKPVIKDLSFSVFQGEIVGLLGANGAGKSTTINILSTILKHDSGSVLIGGFDLMKDKSKIKKVVGIVPQDLAIYEEISAEKNVSFFASLYGLNGAELKANTSKALQQVGLYEHRTEKPKTFSGGMKRRLNIACAIAHAPKLIIMDEPTVGIDPQSRNHILKSILTMREQGATILYSTHYMEEVEAIADRILILDEGQIIASGTKDELCQRYENQITYNFTLDHQPEEQRFIEHERVERVAPCTQSVNLPKSKIYSFSYRQREAGERATAQPSTGRNAETSRAGVEFSRASNGSRIT